MDEQEKKPKKREWVKNAAIIFLAVMLVLTFFSNTILNRTLPEVMTRYVEPNSIDAKVRISGTVSARENYDVIIDQTRKVAAVNVKLGQEVSTGDVLFTLESGDSAELEQAKKDLEAAQLAYQRFLLNLPDYSSDYTEANREIAQLRTALEKAIAERDALPVPAQAALDAAAAAIERAEAAVDSVTALVKSTEQELKDARTGVEKSSEGTDYKDDPEYEKKRDAIRDAAEEQRLARNNYNSAVRSFGKEYDDFKNTILDSLGSSEALDDDDRRFVIDLVDEIFELEVLGYDETIINEYNSSDSVRDAVKRELENEGFQRKRKKENVIVTLPAGSDETEEDKEKRILRETWLRKNYAIPMQLRFKDYEIAPDTEAAAYVIISDAQEKYIDAARNVRDAETAFDTWVEDFPSKDAVRYEGKSHAYWEKEVDRLEQEVEDLAVQKETALEAVEKAKAALETLKQQQTDRKAAEAAVETCQESLEDRLFRLAQQQKDDQKNAGKQQQLNALDIQERQKELAELQEKIDEYSGNVATEVKAKVNGTVASLSVSAGHKAEAGATLATIEVEDLGYTMTATVSVDQAKLLHVGDTANVSNYYWGSRTTAVLSGMQPDPKDPRSSRVLTFDLAGDVNAGDQISFSIGERNASYDLVVPNSALRSDTNGSFVLMITAKNSPLGNRYFATRVDVEVIAADDYNTAVKGALSNMDSVITTSSGNAPVKNGDQVRLADMNNA